PKPQYEEVDNGYIIHYGKERRYNVFITFHDLEEALSLYCVAHLTLNEVSLKMNLTRREFFAIKTAFDITKDSMPFTPKQIDYYTSEELAEKYRIKKKQYALAKIEHNKNKDIENRIKQMDTVDYWHKEICERVNQIKIEPFTIVKRPTNNNEKYIAYLTDIHSGLKVDNYFNKYDIEIMHERFDTLAEGIIESVKSKYIHIAELGDSIHGKIHGSAQKHSVWVNEAVTEVIKGYERLFLTLIKYGFKISFSKVNGSHESIEKVKDERTEEESFGNFIYDMLEWKYGQCKSIKFIPRLKGLNAAIMPLFDYSTLLIHGDNGSLKQLTDADRLFKEYNVTEINAGHIHHRKVEDFNGLSIFYNEPFCGTDQYAGNKLMSSGFGTRLVQYTPEGRGIERLIRL
ncbi:MAG: hypothetical protein GX638_04000, partial [Crenarchaeota archaeon]|nr:hypothetical protein [Thermoproteota archaeon]